MLKSNMRQVRIGDVCGAMSLLIALVLSPDLGATTLQEVYKLAFENDPKYRSALAESRAGGTTIDQARAGFLPTIRYDLDTIKTHNNILRTGNTFPSAVSVLGYMTRSHTLSITQPVFRMDVIARFAQAKAVVRQSEFTLLAAEQDLLLRTTAAYLSVLAATDSVALAAAEREAVGKVLDLARERLKMGLGTITNQFDAAARYAVTEARLVEARNKLRDAQQSLREITGKTVDGLRTLRPTFSLDTPEPPEVERWVESALEQNFILQARREAVDVARQEVERQKAGHFPSVNLLVNHNRRDAGNTLVNGSFGTSTLVETSEVTLRLTVPLFEGGFTSAVSREAAFRFQKSQEDLEVDRRSVERLTRAAYDGTLGAVGLIQALQQSVQAQESALAGKEEGLKAGLLPLLPVLDAQRDLYLARRDYAQSRYDYLLYRLRLKQAAGTLSEADLVAVGAALQ